MSCLSIGFKYKYLCIPSRFSASITQPEPAQAAQPPPHEAPVVGALLELGAVTDAFWVFLLSC